MGNQSRIILAFMAGAAAGAAVAFLVTSDKGEEIIDEFRNIAGKIRDNVKERRGKSSADSEATEEEFMGV